MEDTPMSASIPSGSMNPCVAAIEAISRKLLMCGPKHVGTPTAAASIGLCPPVGTRLPPMNAAVA